MVVRISNKTTKEGEKMKMSEEARKARNDYARKYRAENKKKVHDINIRYWEKKAEKLKAAEELKEK